MPIYSGQTKIKLAIGNQKVKKAYLGNQLVYSAGNIVTYHVDSNITYQEEVDSGASCLSPSSFTPAKSGWTFVGWRTDSSANGTVLTNKVMGDDPITLYAVFRQTVTVTYYNNSTTASSTSGYRYYNNGNVVNPSFTLTQASKSGWTARGWSTSNAGNGSISYSNATAFTRESNITLYGCYQQTITVTYYDNSTTAKTTTGARYYNSSGNTVNPSFTLTQSARSGWTARGWSTGTAGNSGITYGNGVAFTRDSNITLYGMYQQTITLTLYNGSSSATRQTGTRYYCPGSGNTVNPAFTVTPVSLSGWSFNGWAASSGATAAIAYSSISNTAFSANTTLYGRYSQIITLSYNGNGASGGSTAAQTGTRYWNTGNVANPSFTLQTNGFTRTGYTWTKWAMGSAGGTQYTSGTTVVLSSNTIFYAIWESLAFTMDLDINGWTKEIIQGGFADNGPAIRVNPYGDGGIEIIGKGTGGPTTAYDVGGFCKNIDTKGLSKMDINLGTYSGDKGTIKCGDVQIELFQNTENIKNINIAVSPTTQKICLFINDRGDTYHTHSIIIRSLYFHN